MSVTKTESALNDLLNGELAAFHLYMQAAAWCAMNHLDGSRTFFAKHADEELVHFGKIFSYLVEVDAPIHLTALPEPKVAASSIDDLIEQVRAHEQHVTQAVARSVDTAREEDDHSAFEFLQWFVAEQREETNLFREIHDRVALIGDGPHKLYFLDKEMAGLAKAGAAKG